MSDLPTPGIAAADTVPNVTGMEWIVDAYECDADRLRDLDAIAQLCSRVVADLDLNVLGEPLMHRFPHPGGVTLLFMLSESHLACHTYPEFKLATFNLYCCRGRAGWNWDENLGHVLQSERVEIRQVARGLHVPDPSLGARREKPDPRGQR